MSDDRNDRNDRKPRKIRIARPHSSLSSSARKKVRRETTNDNNVSSTSLIGREKINFTNLCINHECTDAVECKYYYEWFVLKYADDPSLQNVCRDKWRDVIHVEYRLLNNYANFKKKAECGCVSKYFNTRERSNLPVCLNERIEGFIDDQFCEQSIKWHEQMINKLSYSEGLQKDFISQTLDPDKQMDLFCKWVGRNWKTHAMN